VHRLKLDATAPDDSHKPMKGETPMKAPHIPFVAAIVVLGLGLASAAIAQTAGVTSPVAPGPDVPSIGLGGIGAGGVSIAPGAEMNGANIERIGPGGGLVAPGPAGGLGGPPVLTTPALPQPRVR
jgi:hypothetical protein